MQILQTSERVRVKIGDIALILAPLKQAQKIQMSKATTVVNGQSVADLNVMLSLAVRYSIKGVEGVKGSSGQDMELEFDHDGGLNENSHTDMMYVISKASAYLKPIFDVAGNTLPSKTVKNELTGEEIEGVEVTVLPKA